VVVASSLAERHVAFTPQAQSVWDQVPEATRQKLLDSGFCTRCLATRHFDLTEAEIRDKELALIGKCGTCGARVVRLVQLG
jgi:hypothetical protein